MQVTKLSSKGQVIIPKQFREHSHWKSGQEFYVVEVEDGLLLKPKQPFEVTTLDDVAACLPYKSGAKSLDEMQAAIEQGVQEWMQNDRS